MYKLASFSLVVIISIALIFGQVIQELPHCKDKNTAGTILVSTLDGKVTALNLTGELLWEVATGPGPLLVSNIHNLELTNNGEYIKIIPSLSGTLYKFDLNTIDPIPITAESLLKSSFRYSDDLVIAGGYEVRTYGVGFETGKILYECSQLKCEKDQHTNYEDVIMVERNTQVIRAVEPKTGHERWNFSVGLNNVHITALSCVDKTKPVDLNITAILPEGILKAAGKNFNWQYKFDTPIVSVWKWDGQKFTDVNLFAPKNVPSALSPNFAPAIYIGMHKKQLYIHESVVMQNILQGKGSNDVVVVESKSIAKIPWKPVPAVDEDTEEGVTGLSVLHSSAYVDGKGFFLYTESDLKKKNSAYCEKNHSVPAAPDLTSQEEDIVEYALTWWKEFILIAVTTVIVNVTLKYWTRAPKKEVIYVERQIEVPTVERRTSERESDLEVFQSRYLQDFDTVRCLGKGGFGVVFEVKSKIDECSYAIKRITLPYETKSKDRVMREVKALAKLEHQNIVRYFYSWLERPPIGWREDHDKNYVADTTNTGGYSAYKTKTRTEPSHLRKKSASISIDIPGYKKDESLSFIDETNDDDSFIVFGSASNEGQVESSASSTKNSSETICSDSTKSTGVNMSDHVSKKINWRKPSRKHHSWDNADCIIQQPTFLYILMALCKQESLKEWLINNQERNYEFSLNIFIQILNAVEYVHLRGLIHRDLKPSNIFFALDGQIKVGDFGLVKDVEDSLDETKKNISLISNGHTIEVGTQLYMSPEQLKNGNYDYKVDIYSLGLIFFELLVPFSTDMERFKILSQLRKGEFPSYFKDKFPNEYKILKEMLCEDPRKRLTTIGIRSKRPFEEISKVQDLYNLPSLQKN
ncbi:unnamed protein product [Brassicogethes aeneus]|uniref:non-specific serine/threonine protein kinase n=1 Tax=Brassicogethes aeneus TaxID=1431903 RepID=A0A9P0BG24_BRAAE|nr:unnamed protein product [Brassicogethes aeneus]